MKRGVDHTRLHPSGQARTQYRFTCTTADAHPVTLGDAARLGVMGMDLNSVFAVPTDVVGTSCLRADVVLRQDSSGGQNQREFSGDLL